MKRKYLYAEEYIGADLSQYHTKELLIILHNARIQNETCFDATSLIEALKAELSTRPHIPNKSEAKKIRQEKAKAKKNR